VVPGLINSHVHLEVNGEPDIQTFFLIRTPPNARLTRPECPALA